jgi:hypothetical protein
MLHNALIMRRFKLVTRGNSHIRAPTATETLLCIICLVSVQRCWFMYRIWDRGLHLCPSNPGRVCGVSLHRSGSDPSAWGNTNVVTVY